MKRDQGIALVVVLLVLALLLTAAGEFARGTRLDAATTANFKRAIVATHLAEAGYQRAVAEISPDALSHELDVRGDLVFRRTRLGTPEVPARLDLALGAERFSYRVTDEAARIQLNRATPDLLHRLLTDLGVERSTRDQIVDSIQDWRDPNEEYRLNGAESDYYLGLPVPYRSKNADFDSADELLQVKGMTRALLYGSAGQPGLAEFLTVVGGGAININTVSPTVLRAQGFAQPQIDLLVAGRPYPDLAALSGGLRRGNQRTRSDTFRIEAWAGGDEPAGRVLTAVVERRTDRAGKVRLVPSAWRWSDTPASRPATAGASRPGGTS